MLNSTFLKSSLFMLFVAMTSTMLFLTNSVSAEDEPEVEEFTGNPYIATDDYSTADLVDYILTMQDKPKIFQDRDGFDEAIIDAADRVLASEDVKSVYERIAILAKLDRLHRMACFDDKEADKQLVALMEASSMNKDKKVVKELAFLTLERRAIDGKEAPLDEVAPLLDELKEFFAANDLKEKHLRLASTTVGLINRYDDATDAEKKDELGDHREKLFGEFGALFAKSENAQLAAYGKKLAGGGKEKASDLVGKEIELTGVTEVGAEFDWKSYRGKVVLVDFWATWCGPCRAEMPKVQALHAKYADQGFDVVGISLDKDLDALAEFIEKNDIPWTTLSGEGTSAMAKKYGVRGIPTMMLIDRDGKVLGVSHNSGSFSDQMKKLFP